MRKELHTVLIYFGYFSYAPSTEEIYTFFPVKITRSDLQHLLIDEWKKKKLVRLPPPHHSRYTLPQYSISASPRHSREGGNPDHVPLPPSREAGLRGDDNTRRIQIYINFLRLLPLVRFVGITGKSAVEGPRINDDIDLFIITQQSSIWTTRFIVVLVAKLLGIHGENGVCLNLFFDESDLAITKIKQNSYIAHEILQVRRVVDKQNIYHALIGVNRWIFNYFPNAQSQYVKRITQNVKNKKYVTRYTLHGYMERLFKSIQLPIIKKNKTGFRITDNQLWLFKRDFEKKLKKNDLRKVI